MEGFALRRINGLTKPAETPVQSEKAKEQIPEEEPEADEPKSKEGGSEVEDDAKGKDVLSQVNLTELSDEDIAELAQKGKSGLLKRIAELTAKRKLAEERTAQLEQYVQQQSKNTPIEPKVENNPFSKVATVEELGKKSQEISEVIEWAEDVLDRAEHLSHEDIAATVDGRQLSKAEVKQHLRDARRAKDKFLPAQHKELVAKANRVQARTVFEASARKELDWLSSTEDNDTRRQYQNMLNDPRLKVLEEAAPDIAMQLPYILAHAANSMFARKTIAIDPPAAPRVKPPSSPTASAAPEQPENRGEKGLKERAKRLSETGSVSDFVALRTAQISKRQIKK